MSEQRYKSDDNVFQAAGPEKLNPRSTNLVLVQRLTYLAVSAERKPDLLLDEVTESRHQRWRCHSHSSRESTPKQDRRCRISWLTIMWRRRRSRRKWKVAFDTTRLMSVMCARRSSLLSGRTPMSRTQSTALMLTPATVNPTGSDCSADAQGSPLNQTKWVPFYLR